MPFGVWGLRETGLIYTERIQLHSDHPEEKKVMELKSSLLILDNNCITYIPPEKEKGKIKKLKK